MTANMGGVVRIDQIPHASCDRVPRETIGNLHISRVQGVYRCIGDDEWVAVSVGSDAEFAALCHVIGHPEVARDERFADVISRRRHHDEFDAIVGEWTAARSQYDAAHALQASAIAAAPVLKIPHL